MISSIDHPLASFGSVGDLLLRTLSAGRISPSYLFEGADAQALFEAAQAFAIGLLSGAPPAEVDPHVDARVRHGNHPDLHHLTKDKATVISVAALSAALERAHSTPLEGAHQVFLIQPAEAMEAEGIARYLKALEEPPPGTVFLLLSSRAERLPETVLSRCRRVRFAPLAGDIIEERLTASGVDASTARFAARSSGGSLTHARRVVDAQLEDIVRPLVEASVAPQPAVAQTVEGALAHLTKRAAELAAADPAATDTKRQHVRVLVADVLRALCVEARERIAGRESLLPSAVAEAEALDLLEQWGELTAAVAANVTPAAILLETVSRLRTIATASAAR